LARRRELERARNRRARFRVEGHLLSSARKNFSIDGAGFRWPAILSDGQRIRHMVPRSAVGRAVARIGRSCPESQRCFEERGPHLFGVCCIIRTRELATRESAVSIFFLHLPGPWKTSFGNIYIRDAVWPADFETALCRPADRHFRKGPSLRERMDFYPRERRDVSEFVSRVYRGYRTAFRLARRHPSISEEG